MKTLHEHVHSCTLSQIKAITDKQCIETKYKFGIMQKLNAFLYPLSSTGRARHFHFHLTWYCQARRQGGYKGVHMHPPFEINDIHKPQDPSHEACAEVLNCSHNFHDIVVDLNLLA